MRNLAARTLLGIGLLCSFPASADGTLVSWSPNSIEGMSEERWNAAKKLDADAIVSRLRSASDWATAYEALLGANAHKADTSLLGRIAGEISNPAKGKLTGTAGLIVWDRVRAGEILFEGKGLVIEDDIFGVAGRANWVLRTVLKKDFGYVTNDSKQPDLDAIRQRWEGHLAGKDVPEVPPAYPSDVEGLEELRSPAAVAALIASLEASPAKDKLTASCLKRVYGLDKMPEASDAPARLCDPDTSTHRYLAVITVVQEQHTPDWWKNWWQQHRASLRWDPTLAKFLPSKPGA